jgi:hypothetical protein
MPALGMGWMLPGAVGCVLGPVLLAVGLARARVLAWWSVALPVVMGVMFAAAQALGAIGFLVTLVIGTAYGVIVAVGLRRHAVAEPA